MTAGNIWPAATVYQAVFGQEPGNVLTVFLDAKTSIVVGESLKAIVYMHFIPLPSILHLMRID